MLTPILLFHGSGSLSAMPPSATAANARDRLASLSSKSKFFSGLIERLSPMKPIAEEMALSLARFGSPSVSSFCN